MGDRNFIHTAHLIGSTGIYGAERWILAQLRYLDRRRIRASIINLVDHARKESAIVAEARACGYDAEDFYTGGRFNLLATAWLARRLRQNRVDILHSHGYKSDIVGLLAGRLAGTKLISTCHGWSKEADKKLVLFERFGRLALRLFDRICPLSPALYHDVCKAGINPSKIALIVNGVDIDEIDAAPANRPLSGKKRIGYIGQFIQRKNLQNLVEAFHRLARADCELHLIGDGPCREDIIRYIAAMCEISSVYCPGYSSRRLQDLKGLDVFVLPSLLEGIPRCIMEAHVARIPVVATNIDGTRALIEDGETGLLVPPGDPQALADAIRRVLDSPQFAATLTSRARTIVEENFSAARMAAQYEEIYLSVAFRSSVADRQTAESSPPLT